MRRTSALTLLATTPLVMAAACDRAAPPPAPAASSYFDNTGRPDALAGGARLIPVKMPKGTFNLWTKRVGNNPCIKVLLLHGGPAGTHAYFEAFDSYFPGEGIESGLVRFIRDVDAGRF